MRGRFVEVYEYRIFLDSEGGIVQYDGEPIYINVDWIVSVKPIVYSRAMDLDTDEIDICSRMGAIRLENGERYLIFDYMVLTGNV